MGHELTTEDRARGGRNRGEALRKKRAELERKAEEKLESALERAATVYVEALEAEAGLFTKEGELHTTVDHRTRIQGADRINDRLLGKPIQKTELSGDVGISVNVDELRTKLDTLVTRDTETK